MAAASVPVLATVEARIAVSAPPTILPLLCKEEAVRMVSSLL